MRRARKPFRVFLGSSRVACQIVIFVDVTLTSEVMIFCSNLVAILEMRLLEGFVLS
jgi:hypothetical protein